MSPALRATARLAWRDAWAHRLRTLMALALVVLPVAALVGAAGINLSTPPTRQAALASLPPGVQARVTGTAVNPMEGPITQRPEALPPVWFDDPSVTPLSATDLTELVPAADEVHQYWRSGNLLATTQIAEGGGQEAVDLDSLDVTRIGQVVLTEADPAALDLLMPPVTQGAAPDSPDEGIISTALARRTGAQVGDRILLLGPPPTGWHSTDGRVDEVLGGQQHVFQVVGTYAGTEEGIWAPQGWLADATAADPRGVETHFLVTGPEPVPWGSVKELNNHMALALSRDAIVNYPPDAELYPESIDPQVLMSLLVMAVVTGAAGLGLLLALITPAFVVASEQQRRVLALASATGASPRHLRRIFTHQGLSIGCLGGVIGVLAGLAAVAGIQWYRNPDAQLLYGFPWWVLAVALVISTSVGWLATFLPARRVGRIAPAEALRQRTEAPPARRRGWLRLTLGLVLLGAGLAAATASLRTPLPTYDDPSMAPPETVISTALILLVVALLCSAAGTMALVGSFLSLLSRLAPHLPLVLRVAVREVSLRRRRSLPLITALAVVTGLAGGQCVYSASMFAAYQDGYTQMVAPGYLVLGPSTPVSPEFDQALLESTAQELKDHGLPVMGTRPVYAPPLSARDLLDPQPAPGKECPVSQAADLESTLGLRTKVRCVPYGQALSRGFVAPWFAIADVMVMDGNAMRASGFSWAQKAAQVLDAGGVVVRDATHVGEDGMVHLAGGAVVPGMAAPELGAVIAFSPQTAAALGATGENAPAYVGAMVELNRPLTSHEEAQVRQVVERYTSLVIPGLQDESVLLGYWIEGVTLGALALTTLVVALVLARTQQRGEQATMHAVGASPRFLRAVTASQTAVMLAVALPLGAAAGWGMGAYLVAWNRHTMSMGLPWLRTEGEWGWQVLALAAFCAVGLGLAWALGRPARELVVRRMD